MTGNIYVAYGVGCGGVEVFQRSLSTHSFYVERKSYFALQYLPY